MWRTFIVAFVLYAVALAEDDVSQVLPPTVAATKTNITQEGEKKLSDTIMSYVEHYKHPDPVGLPGAPIPDPMDIPPMKHSFSIGRMDFKNVKLYGLKKFKIEHIVADIHELRVEAALTIDVLDVIGNYTLSTWLSRANGPFTVKLTMVTVTAVARLEVERNGRLEAQAMEMDIHFKDIAMDFKGLGFFANMFQSMMNSVGTFVFDSIKPFILEEANTNIRRDVNKEVHKFPKKFPNSISPFDEVVCEIRKRVRHMGLDPYRVPAYNSTAGICDVFLTHTWVYGISSFHRTKDILFEMRNNTLYAFLEVGTGILKGISSWEISFVAGLMAQVGRVDFTVDYFRVQVNLSQSMDVSKHPVLDDIQLELGNIQIRFDGLGTADYLIELGINILPNLLRYQIMDALEKPVKLRVQEALDQVIVENIIRENADKLDNMNTIDALQNL